MSDNMKLWDSVCTTDPKYTKKVNQRGGFTAIGAQYQIRLATEQWGPYGGKWGVRDIKYRFIPPKDMPGIMLTGEFYYPDGSFPLAVDMVYHPKNDCCKKLLTDLTTKALSKLGFNADVFMGMFDDNKYVATQSEPKSATSGTTQKQIASYKPDHANADIFAKIKNKDGQPYSDLDIGALVIRFNALEKKLKSADMTPEERAERELKRDAAKYYIEIAKG